MNTYIYVRTYCLGWSKSKKTDTCINDDWGNPRDLLKGERTNVSVTVLP